jgi:glycosyltransferase involved in cell wall biosynthesis
MDIQLGIFIQRQILLMKDDFDFYVVYTQAVPDLEQTYEIVESNSHGFTENVVYFRAAKGPFRKIIQFFRYRKAQKIGLSKIPDSFNGCHVHVPYRSAMPALNFKKRAGIPFLITEHWSGHLNGQFNKKNFIDKWMYRRVLKKAAAISTVSKALKYNFKLNTGTDSTVIPNYIERASISATKKQKESIEILSVGDIHDPTKNFSGLIQAFERAQQENKQLVLTIVGDGPDRQKIENLAYKSAIPAASIQFKGRLPHHQVLKEIMQCDFYICNSNYETFGMTVAEALYAGKPVICTRCGGPEEFMTDENGLLIDPNAPKQLTATILKMANEFKFYETTKLAQPIENQFGQMAVRKAWKQFYSKHLS